MKYKIWYLIFIAFSFVQSGLQASNFGLHYNDATDYSDEQYLIKSGYYHDYEPGQTSKKTKLMKAVQSGDISLVNKVLHKTGCTDAQDTNGLTALDMAIEQRNVAMVQAMTHCRKMNIDTLHWGLNTIENMQAAEVQAFSPINEETGPDFFSMQIAIQNRIALEQLFAQRYGQQVYTSRAKHAPSCFEQCWAFILEPAKFINSHED